ncbi:glycosyltransferase [Facklamia sp. P12934]|uniref:glycosyltransferase n=1 Tax=Facklamia sp. P12934 TaxID=3421948 RepID=UPI003D1794C3
MKKSLLIVLPNIGNGGAERVVTNLLNNIDRNKFIVSLVLLREEGDYIDDLKEDIKIYNINASRSRYSIIPLIKIINSMKPDIVFSTLRGVSMILSLIRPFLVEDIKYVFREENTPSISINDNKFPILTTIYYKTLYKKADIIICQSKYMQSDLINNFSFPKNKTIQIYNPVDFNNINEQLKGNEIIPLNKNKFNILLVGRLTKQKGLENLLFSVKKNIHQLEVNNAHIHIIGDGELSSELNSLSNQLRLNDFVTFHGRQSNPYIWMKESDLYLLTSRYEGLPNSLLEAAACKCNIITNHHPGGTKEIMKILNIENNIVKDINFENFWFNLSSQFVNYKEFFDVFNLTSIIKEYEKVFESLFKEK